MAATDDRSAQRPVDDAGARFAACLADIAAHVDDPRYGADCQGFLDDDPQEQRAMFDLVEALAASPAPIACSPLAMALAVLMPIIVVVVVVVVRFL